MKKKLLLPALLVLLCNYIPFYAQNKIDKSKGELTQKSATSSNSNKSSSKTSIRNEDVGIFIEILGYVFVYGIVGDYRNEDNLYNNLSPYPFFKPEIGNYYQPVIDSTQTKFFRIDGKGAFLYNSNNLCGSHIELKARASQYIHLQTDFYQIYEFQKLENTSDRLSLYYFNLGYDRIRAERFNLGWTFGASYVGGEVKKTGFSYGVNAEFFMEKDISFLADAKWSKINNQPVNSYSFEGKYHKKNYFFSLGFRHLKIATPTYNFVSIGCGIYL